MEDVVQNLQQQNTLLVEELRLLREQTTDAFTRLSARLDLQQAVPQPVPSQSPPVNVNVAPVISSSASSSN